MEKIPPWMDQAVIGYLVKIRMWNPGGAKNTVELGIYLLDSERRETVTRFNFLCQRFILRGGLLGFKFFIHYMHPHSSNSHCWPDSPRDPLEFILVLIQVTCLHRTTVPT